jgi:hypothetical protein
VVALLQRVSGDRPGRVRDRGVGLPGRQQRQRRLVQPRLGLGGEPVPLHHQPGLERRAGRHVNAVQQLAVELQQRRRVGLPANQRVHVDRGTRTKGGGHRVAPEQP